MIIILYYFIELDDVTVSSIHCTFIFKLILRTVYAIDLPGFGLSDRTKLGEDATEVETNWTDSAWI